MDVGALRNATYTGLAPGHYTFKVTACNQDCIWSTEATALSFYLRPYFYQAVWFHITSLLFVLLASVCIIKWRSWKLVKEKRQLEEIVMLRTKEINNKNFQLETQTLKLKEQSDQLKVLNEARSRFFANISHEFRTPLTLIMGPLEQILSEKPEKEMQAKVNLMLRNSRRLLNLINQLLELAKFESGKMKLEASLQDIVPFVRNVAMCFESLALQKKVALVFKSQVEQMPVYFDPEKLEKIITNLLSNAFNYTFEAGKIGVLIRKSVIVNDFPAGCVEISVRDTGAGIPGDQMPYIFDRFYRGKGEHGYQRKGTGIGLALCKELLELHHGDILVNSSFGDDSNNGTEFIIRLPLGKEHLHPDEIVDQEVNDQLAILLDSPVTNSSKNFCEGPGGGFYKKSPLMAEGKIKEDKPIILVVEDNNDVRAYIRSSFENHFKVIEASDGNQGIYRAREDIPDLIICDIRIPGIDGFEVCRTLKSDIITSHIPIIVLTAAVSEQSVLQALETGADDYITKPFSIAVLATRIMNLINLRRQLQLERKNHMIFQPAEITIWPVDDEFYKKLRETVEKHLSDPDFNVEALCRVLQMSQATLYRKIQALTGKNPTSFIRSYRIMRAKQLLTVQAGSISEVADKVGFIDKSYFARCFKEQFHCLPSDIQPTGANTGIINEKFLQVELRETIFSKSETPGSRRKEIILVVEDNEDARQYIRKSLEPEYRIVEAADGSEGVARAIEIVPDLVISDIMMPEVDGYELCRILKNDVRTCHIPIALLTAKASEESIIHGLENRADDYIIKPFNIKILQARLKNLIHLRRHLQKNRNREMALLPGKISESVIDQEFIKELEVVMEKNFSNSEFNVEQLAKKLYVSRLTLYRKILAIYGEPPTEFMRSYRLKRAAQLLEVCSKSVLEVALDVGFSNSSYFTKCFKEAFHQSPSHYQVSRAK